MTNATSDEFTCPWTSDRVEISLPPKKSADEFCPDCDFPMFWMYDVEAATHTHLQAQQQLKEARAIDGSDRAKSSDAVEKLQREAARKGFVPCPSCGVLHHQDRKFCSNCGTETAEEVGPATPTTQPLLEFDWRPLALFLLVVAVAVAGAVIWLDLL